RNISRVNSRSFGAGKMRTQVGIIGAGPAGLLPAHMLRRDSIDCVILENRSREYVQSRRRAGAPERTTGHLMHELRAGERLKRDGMPDPQLDIRFAGGHIMIDLNKLTPGKIVTVYGQQEVVKDLVASWIKQGGTIEFEAEAFGIDGITNDRVSIHYRQ